MTTTLRYWFYRLTGQRRRAGGLIAAETRRENKRIREGAVASKTAALVLSVRQEIPK